MKMKTLQAAILVAIGLLLIDSLFAQTAIQGRILDQSGDPQSFANVLLLNPVDSSLIKGAITDLDGTYQIDKIEDGNFLLMASVVGYDDAYSAITIDQENVKGILDLEIRAGVQLQEVEIKAKKPLFEQKIDRTVVNVGASVTAAGSTALEILERSPGVVVNRQNSGISILGKDGVVVMIDGKISYMPAEALIQMLDAMNADNIDRIELITTPPAKYDAEGNAGYINIVFKENINRGLNGSYSLSAGYGQGEIGSTNLNLNYRKDKLNIYGSYTYARDSRFQFFENYRKLNFEGVKFENISFSDRYPDQNDHNARIVLDYDVSDKTSIGFIVGAYDNKWTMDAENVSEVVIDNQLDTVITLVNSERNQWKHFRTNAYFNHKLTEKQSLEIDFDYLYYEDENPTLYDNTYSDAQGSLLFEENVLSDKYTPIKIYVGEVDYSNNISEKMTFELGSKLTNSEIRNEVKVERLNGNEWVSDGEFTNTSYLTERIYAGYASVDYEINEKTGVKLGLRYEHTDSNLDTDTQQDVVDRTFGKVFPTFYISHKINEDQGINFSANQRITRPTYNDMAPFVIFIDPSTFFFGNTALQPAIASSAKIDYRIKSKIFTFQYTHEDSTIARFQDQVIEETNQQLISPINMKNTKTFSASVSLPFYIGNWWEMRYNLFYINQEVNSYYNREPVSVSQNIFRANVTQSFILPKDYSLELTGFYRSPGLWGIAEFDSIFGVNFGVQKKFGENGGTLRLAVRDIFDSIQWSGGTKLEGQNFETSNTWDFRQRTFMVSYSRSFGNQKLKASKNRQGGSADEQNRIN